MGSVSYNIIRLGGEEIFKNVNQKALMANMEVGNLFRFTAVRPMFSHSKWGEHSFPQTPRAFSKVSSKLCETQLDFRFQVQRRAHTFS